MSYLIFMLQRVTDKLETQKSMLHLADLTISPWKKIVMKRAAPKNRVALLA